VARGASPSRSLLTVVILWAPNFIAGKIALRNLPAPAVASFRVCLGGLAMLPAYLLFSRTSAFADALKLALAVSTPAISGHSSISDSSVSSSIRCVSLGLSHRAVSHGAVIVGMAPVYTSALAVVFRVEKRPGANSPAWRWPLQESPLSPQRMA
jgi:drug/metabolite transporter (DMT)-like permease